MPIYEFVCEECGEDFEALLRMGSFDEVKCPQCQSEAVHRKVSRISVSSPGGIHLSFGSPSSQSSCGSSGHST